MLLTSQDKEWMRDLMVASEERVYNRIRDGALSDLKQEFGEMKQEFGEMIGEVGRRVDDLGNEIRVMNDDVAAIRNHLDI